MYNTLRFKVLFVVLIIVVVAFNVVNPVNAETFDVGEYYGGEPDYSTNGSGRGNQFTVKNTFRAYTVGFNFNVQPGATDTPLYVKVFAGGDLEGSTGDMLYKSEAFYLEEGSGWVDITIDFVFEEGKTYAVHYSNSCEVLSYIDSLMVDNDGPIEYNTITLLSGTSNCYDDDPVRTFYGIGHFVVMRFNEGALPSTPPDTEAIDDAYSEGYAEGENNCEPVVEYVNQYITTTEYVDKIVEVEVEKIIYVDKEVIVEVPVEVEKIVYVDKIVEVVKVVVETVPGPTTYIEVPVEKIVYVDKVVECTQAHMEEEEVNEEPVQPEVITGGALVGTGKEVIVEFMGKDAAHRHVLYSMIDGKRRKLGWSHQVGRKVSLGKIPVGTVIDFKLLNKNTRKVYITGSADANPDGVVHAQTTSIESGLLLGFEDMWKGGDKDYNDCTFKVYSVDGKTKNNGQKKHKRKHK